MAALTTIKGLYWLVTGRKFRWMMTVILLVGVAFMFCLPEPLFKDPACTIVKDRQGVLLAAKISDDGQWRFPEQKTVPEKFRTAITYFEDEYFDYHPGI